MEHSGTARALDPGQESESDPASSAEPRGRSGIQSPERDAPTEQSTLRYPLNSRRLTVAHLCAIAEAIGLPSAGSADQLRQCIEGKLQTERDNPNIVVVVCEVRFTGQTLALADSEGEFVQTSPLQRGQGTSRDENVPCEIHEVRAQLQEAERIIESARTKDAEQAQQKSKTEITG